MIEGRLIDYDGCCLSYLYASGRTYGVRHGRIMILPVLVLGAHAARRRLTVDSTRVIIVWSIGYNQDIIES